MSSTTKADNLLVLQTLWSSMSSHLGSQQRLKCMYNSANQSESYIAFDSGEMIASLTANMKPPIAGLVHQTCRAQLQAHGTGAVSLLCLATAWLQQALVLVDEGIPSPVVATLMEEAVSICTRTLQNLAIPLSQFVQSNNPSSASKNISSQHRILKYSRHFRPLPHESSQQSFSLPSLFPTLKKLSHGREEAFTLALRVLEIQNRGCISDLAEASLDTEAVVMEEMVGIGEEQSEVMEGVLCKADSRQSHLLAGDQPLSLLVVGSSAVSKTTAKNHQMMHTIPEALFNHQVLWQDRALKELKRLGVTALAAEGTVDHSLTDACLSHKIAVLSGMSHLQLINMRAITGGRIVHNLQSALPEDLGKGVAIELREGGWKKQRVYYCNGDSNPTPLHCLVKTSVNSRTKVSSVMLCGRTRDSVVGLKHATSRVLNQLKCVLQDGSILPGGGQSEIACAQVLDTECNAVQESTQHFCSSWMGSLLDTSRPAVHRAVKNGLLHYAATVLQNCSPGLSVYDAHSQVKAIQAREPQLEVLDQLSSKIHCMTSACELVKLLLNT